VQQAIHLDLRDRHQPAQRRDRAPAVPQEEEKEIEGQAEVEQLIHGTLDDRTGEAGQPGRERLDGSREVDLPLDGIDQRRQPRMFHQELPPLARGHVLLDLLRAGRRLHDQALSDKRCRYDHEQADGQHRNERRDAGPPELGLEPPLERREQHRKRQRPGQGRQERQREPVTEIDAQRRRRDQHERPHMAVQTETFFEGSAHREERLLPRAETTAGRSALRVAAFSPAPGEQAQRA